MIKNRYVQIGVRSCFVIIGIISAILSIGIFAEEFHSEFYVWYTNLSNYLVLGVLISELVINIVQVCKKETVGTKDTPVALKYVTLIGILVTFFVTNILLSTPFTAEYWMGAENVLMHFVNPLLFLLDYILFRNRHEVKWYFPLLSVIFPSIYLIFVFVRASIILPLPEGSMATVYPYFFLDVATLGVGGVIIWICILVAVFVTLGYILMLFDKLAIEDRRVKFVKSIK